MKKQLSREFKIGAFGIAMILLLYFSINFIKSNRVFSNDKTFYAVFQSADGLEASAPVMTKGFRIGTVEKVAFDLATQDIIVTISVQKEYPVPTDSKVKITSSSLLGGKVIEILFGHDRTVTFADKDTIPSIFEPSLMQMAGAEYSQIKDKIGVFAAKIDNALTGLESLLDQQNVANLKNSISNLNNATGDIATIIDQRKANINNLIQNLETLSADLRAAAPDLKRTMTNLAAASDSLPSTMQHIAIAVDNLTAILNKVQSGEGNLGKLINDDKLYDNLNQSLASLNGLILDLKENPKKYINVVVFPRKEKTIKN